MAPLQKEWKPFGLKSENILHQDICRLADISATTLTRYLKTYETQGLDALKELIFRQPKSELESFRLILVVYFEKNPPASIKKAMSDIEKLTGLKRSENRIRVFLNSLGMKRQKTGMIPAKADVA